MTCISARKTQQFESAWGVFSYRSVKPQYMLGYRVVEKEPGNKFKIACLEKAVLDYLYLHPAIQSKEDFEGLRWNQAQLQRLLDSAILTRYVGLFNKRALDRRVITFLEYQNA